MNLIFLISIVLKGIGALLEILLQITITRTMGLSGYGTYSTWINLADLIFWCLFSGIVKLNTFYLANREKSIHSFKVKYYLRFVIPVVCVIGCLSLFGEHKYILYVASIVLVEVLVLDKSSTLLAEGKHIRSLVGEYVLGRMFLLISIIFCLNNASLSLETLVFLYLLQYLLVLCIFSVITKSRKKEDISDQVSLKKWGRYQRADIMQSMIGQMPVILQYMVVGSFEAGMVSIVLLVKKLINFISGPTAKIFLPEFSRLYHRGEKEGIQKSFASIMRMQMLFVGPMAVVLVGYPKVVLRILAEELIDYRQIFVCCAIVFLIAATLGPCGGLMQMTENEKQDNRCREIAILAMIMVFIIFRKNSLFALYGLCIQTFMESVSKYIFVCKWLGKSPIRIKTYIEWWILPILVIGITYIFQWQESILAMLLMAFSVFIIKFIQEFKDKKELIRLMHK